MSHYSWPKFSAEREVYAKAYHALKSSSLRAHLVQPTFSALSLVSLITDAPVGQSRKNTHDAVTAYEEIRAGTGHRKA